MNPYERNVSSIYGAPMGRHGTIPENLNGKIHLRRVPLVDGCYDPGGAYWGAPNNLWCAWDDDGNEHYFRATDRETAKLQFPHCTFYR